MKHDKLEKQVIQNKIKNNRGIKQRREGMEAVFCRLAQ